MYLTRNGAWVGTKCLKFNLDKTGVNHSKHGESSRGHLLLLVNRGCKPGEPIGSLTGFRQSSVFHLHLVSELVTVSDLFVASIINYGHMFYLWL